MRRWKLSKGLRAVLFCLLFAGIFLEILAGMYISIGKDYAQSREKADFFISQENTSQLLDGYIRLFEEYMQIANLITTEGDIDYDKEILVSLTDEKTYTVKELLRGAASEGKGSGMLRDFMKEFSDNCRKGISYPWKSRFMLSCETRVIIEGDRILSFVSPNAKSRSPKQITNMQDKLDNMYATSTDDVTCEDDFRDSISVSFSKPVSWKSQFHAKSVYEEYLITYFPAYARCYYIEKLLDSYKEPGQSAFLAAYRAYEKEKPEKLLSEKRFYQQLENEYMRRSALLPEDKIPWRVHSVPRTMAEAKKYVSFLVETYQELKFLFSKCNFIYAYENSGNVVMTNHPEEWQRIKALLESGRPLKKATDESDVAFMYYNSRNEQGVGNLPRETLPMSGNIIEKVKNIGKSFSQASYQIAVGIDWRTALEAGREDEFVLTYREMVEKSRLYHIGVWMAWIGGLLGILSFLLLCIRCGSPVEEGREREPLYWYDRLWLEAQVLAWYLMGSMMLWIWRMWNGFLIHPMIFLCALAMSLPAYGCLHILLSVIKRRKLHCSTRYSIVLLFFREVLWKKVSLRTFFQNLSYSIAFVPTRRKFGFLLLMETGLLVYFGFSVIYVLLDREETLRSYVSSPLGMIGIVLGAVFLGILLVWQRNAMYDQKAEYEVIAAMKQIIGGDFSYQLPEKDTMSLRVRELVRAVNQMGAVVESAVEESVKSERMKTELIANVSHDIKTPLTSIINYVDLLRGEDIRNETIRKYVDVLEKKSQRLKVLMEDLIEASKASSGVMELDIHPLDFRELVWQTNGEFEERFAECSLELVAELPQESMVFAGDGRRVFRILENLYSNVAKYAMAHTRVYVSLEREEERLVFTMKNISAMKLNITPEELTERFVRGDHARTTEGSGLGLSIAKSLTELMGGEFRILLDGDLFCAKIAFPEMTEG